MNWFDLLINNLLGLTAESCNNFGKCLILTNFTCLLAIPILFNNKPNTAAGTGSLLQN
jgi:hypothetical protein